jgi:hypothetical protein
MSDPYERDGRLITEVVEISSSCRRRVLVEPDHCEGGRCFVGGFSRLTRAKAVRTWLRTATERPWQGEVAGLKD